MPSLAAAPPEDRESVPIPDAPRPGHGLWVYLLVGIAFGFLITKGEVISWFRIQEMFRFQGFHMFGIFATALPVAILSVQLVKRRGVRSTLGTPLLIPPKVMGSGTRYIAGGTTFGMGWALTGACPGPLFALLGAGILPIAVVILSAMAGAWVYGYLRPRLPHQHSLDHIHRRCSMHDLPISRRQWLVGAAAAALLPGVACATATFPRPADPADALRRLIEGNQHFAQGRTTNPNRTLARLQELGSSQMPFAAVLACADSRVPVEILFDQGFGDLFVTRLAGNIATSEAIGSLEYSAQVLGAQLVMVLGHSACGAVKATMENAVVPGQIGSLYPYIRPAVESDHDQGEGAVIAQNVRNQVQILRNASPVIASRIRNGTLDVLGGVFDFRTGLVTLVAPRAAAA